jgi:SAM-dependent methyltransferase
MRFTDVDWDAEWAALKRRGKDADDPTYWNGRARGFASACSTSSYQRTLIEYLGIRQGETVFDMGCGSGTLALALAAEGHPVTAVDFSEEMLSILDERAGEQGLVDRITTIRASWNDDWREAGIPSADVVVASRSFIVTELGAALGRLDAMARRRVCITLPAGGPPGHNPMVFEAVGRASSLNRGYMCCMNALFERGIAAELRFIESEKFDRFEGLEEARDRALSMLGDVTPEEERLLDAHIAEHFSATTDKHGRQVFVSDQPRMSRWAFISWDKHA